MKKLLKRILPRPLFTLYYEFWALLGALIYRFPSHDIRVIGVTGTNGKTSTVHLTTHILEEAGYKVASISSVRFKIGDKEWKNTLKMTMPGRLAIQKFLRRAVYAGCDVVILEVTSEGIVQRRHKYITFDTAVFTNLTPEHIESHGSFELYKKAKGELFAACGNIHIINMSDKYADYFLQFPAKKIMRYEGFYMEGNRAAARAIALAYGVQEHVIAKALASAPQTPGRMEVVVHGPVTVIVDYAHTPDALEKTYKAISKTYNLKSQNSNLICVLGSAGGGRDTWKRRDMGKIAAEYCDTIILTNEDPYDEDPVSILHEVESGIKTTNYKLILDRRKAIRAALRAARSGDVVIITGKGSEPLMMTKEGPTPWDDRAVVREEFPHV